MNNRVRQAAVAGHVCADLRPALTRTEPIDPGALVEVGPLTIRPGGCVANTGGDLSALGAPVRMVANVGDDELGSILTRLLTETRSDCEGIRTLAGSSTSYSLVFEPPGRDRAFWHHVGANACFDGALIDPTGVDLVHLGYPPLLPSLYANGGDSLHALLERVAQSGATTSLDLSTLADGSPAAMADWQSLLARITPLVDVFSPSVDDLVTTLRVPRPSGNAEVRALGRYLVDLGAGMVLLTDGEQGMHLITGSASRLRRAGRCLASHADIWAGQEWFVPADTGDSDPVVVTTGAGDAATAGLLYGILTAASPKRSALLAAGAAAYKVSGKGSLPYGAAGLADPKRGPYR